MKTLYKVKQARCKRANIVCVHIYELAKVIKFMDTESKGCERERR